MQDGILKLLLLLGGVCIIESDEELALAVGGALGKVIVKESSLGVADVKETTCERVSMVTRFVPGVKTYLGSGGNRVTTPSSMLERPML